VGSTLKVRSPEAKTLIDKIKAELKKRAELKAQRMLLNEPKGSRSASRSTGVELTEVSPIERRCRNAEFQKRSFAVQLRQFVRPNTK